MVDVESAPNWITFIIQALQRIEDKLDKKADSERVKEIDVNLKALEAKVDIIAQESSNHKAVIEDQRKRTESNVKKFAIAGSFATVINIAIGIIITLYGLL